MPRRVLNRFSTDFAPLVGQITPEKTAPRGAVVIDANNDKRTPAEPQHEFLEAYDSYLEKIYRYILSRIRVREVAQDLTSDVFTRAWAFLKKGAAVKHWGAFLYTLATNALRDFGRSRGRRERVFSSIAPHALENNDRVRVEPDSDRELDRRREYEVALVNLNNLKPTYRQVVFLRYVEGYRTCEIATIMNRSSTWVRVTLHRALKRLRSGIRRV
ncbi:RNA polymerase sigma factor [Candidatus Parcubacteria bacterium]|nr:RNA polymerase sigma factor [Candidatus Parcubacteria bacterium]